MTALLLLRSFVELIIVAIIYGAPKHLSIDAIARDILYSIISTALASAYFLVARDDQSWAENKEEYINNVGNVQERFNRELQEVTDNGRRTAPQMLELIRRLEPSAGPNTAQRDELRRIKRGYKRWQPIIKTSV